MKHFIDNVNKNIFLECAKKKSQWSTHIRYLDTCLAYWPLVLY